MNEFGTRWTSKTIRTDVDTGETITEYTAKRHYTLIKTNKTTEINARRTTGTVEYHKLYKRNAQQELDFN